MPLHEIAEPHLRRRALRARSRSRENRIIRDHLAAWLARHEWEWFGHLTFRACRSDVFAERAVVQWLNRCSRSAWGRNYQNRSGEGVYCYAGFELQKRGDWHAHVLCAGTNGADSLVGKKQWEMFDRKTGEVTRIARVYDYDPTRGGAAYCTKYVTKDANDRGFWRLYGPWRGQQLFNADAGYARVETA